MKLFFFSKILTIIIVFGLAACSPSKTSEEYLTNANLYIEKGESSAAVIELKNAINNDFNNYHVRQLLGDIYLKQGLAAAAEKEFRFAIQLGGEVNNIIPRLLKSLNILERHKDVLDVIDHAGRISIDILPIVKLYSAIAYQNLGDIEQAKSAVSEASDISSDSVYTRLGDAYLKGNSSSSNKEALEALTSIINEDSSIIEAYLLQGKLYFVEGDYIKSIGSFEKYQNLAPQDLKIKLFLANSYLNNKQFIAADKELDYILKINPQHAFSNQLKGVISYQQANYQQALAFTEIAIQNGIDSTSNKIVAGLSAFQQKKYETAYQYLNGVQKELSPNHPVIKVLAMVHMALGYDEKVLDVLGNMEDITPEDAMLFTSASFELLKSGNIKGAKSMLLKADSLEDNSAEGSARIGILKLSLNDLEGLTDLEKAIDLDSDLPMAKVALISAYINNDEFDKAISIAQDWKQQDINKVVGYNLLAKIYFEQKSIINAEIELSKALEIAPENPYSLLYFANKALEDNRIDLANEKLNILLNKYPTHIKGLSLFYRVQKEFNQTDIALSRIEQAFEQSNRDIQYQILYAKTLLKEKAYQQVINVFASLTEVNGAPIPVIVWALLGTSYEKLNQFEKALGVYDDWIKNNPDSRYAYQKKVTVQESMKDYSGAQSTVEKVLRKVPEDVEFTVMLAYFQQKNGFTQTAQKTINSLPENTKKMIVVKEIQGKIFFDNNQFKKALPNFIDIYAKSPTASNMSYVYSSYNKANQEAKALSFLKAHVNNNQQELYGKTFLAERSMGADNNLAKRLFGELLEEKPMDGALLNNIAWVEWQLGNLTEAEIHVNSALKVLNDHPKVLDTLGLIKLKQGKTKDAIQVFEKALTLAPNDEEIRQHLLDAKK